MWFWVNFELVAWIGNSKLEYQGSCESTCRPLIPDPIKIVFILLIPPSSSDPTSFHPVPLSPFWSVPFFLASYFSVHTFRSKIRAHMFNTFSPFRYVLCGSKLFGPKFWISGRIFSFIIIRKWWNTRNDVYMTRTIWVLEKRLEYFSVLDNLILRTILYIFRNNSSTLNVRNAKSP